MLSKIIRHSPKLLINFIYFFASLIPRNKNLWLFACWGGKSYSDNPKHIFIKLNKSTTNITSYWLVKDKDKFKKLKNDGVDVLYAFSMFGIWIQLRAGLVTFTHSVDSEYVSFLIAHRVLRVQTWHGIPVKKIGYDDINSTPRQIIKIWNLVFPYKSDHLDLVLAASEADKELYKNAFNVNANAIVITGYPRNDALLKATTPHNPIKVIYMPTYRGAVNSTFDILKKTEFKFDSVDQVCEKIGVELYIKLHPVQRFDQKDIHSISFCKNIHILQNDGDIYDCLCEFDVLITDFSGVYFDYLITGKPIIMAPFNLEEYLLNDRNLYYDYQEICPNEPAKNWDQVFYMLRQIRENKFYYDEKYMNLQLRFHKYLDARSSDRAIKAMQDLMMNNSKS